MRRTALVLVNSMILPLEESGCVSSQDPLEPEALVAGDVQLANSGAEGGKCT